MEGWAAELIELAKAIVGPLIGAFIAIFTMNRQKRETLSAQIIWDWGHKNERRDWEEPYIHIHNRSELPVMLAEIQLRRGLIIRSKASFPLEWHDEPAFSFPYRIDAGESWQYQLSKSAIERETDKAGIIAKALGYLRFPYVKIRAKTIAGTSISVDAADGTPYQDRPRWLKR